MDIVIRRKAITPLYRLKLFPVISEVARVEYGSRCWIEGGTEAMEIPEIAASTHSD